jgi:hypothetical protein
VIVKQEKSAETIANEMGFKVGDKIWYSGTKEYYGKITKFILQGNHLYCETDIIHYGSKMGSMVSMHGNVTNKASVQVMSKEESAFISKLLNCKDLWTDNTAGLVYNINRPDLAIDVDITYGSIKAYLEGIGLKPDQIAYRFSTGLVYEVNPKDAIDFGNFLLKNVNCEEIWSYNYAGNLKTTEELYNKFMKEYNIFTSLNELVNI